MNKPRKPAGEPRFRYEWDVEVLSDLVNRDIIDHHFKSSFAECLEHVASVKPEDRPLFEIVLVCYDDECTGDTDRGWAYLNEDGTLPTHFGDSGGNDWRRVPKRFHDEVTRARTVPEHFVRFNGKRYSSHEWDAKLRKARARFPEHTGALIEDESGDLVPCDYSPERG